MPQIKKRRGSPVKVGADRFLPRNPSSRQRAAPQSIKPIVSLCQHHGRFQNKQVLPAATEHLFTAVGPLHSYQAMPPCRYCTDGVGTFPKPPAACRLIASLCGYLETASSVPVYSSARKGEDDNYSWRCHSCTKNNPAPLFPWLWGFF